MAIDLVLLTDGAASDIITDKGVKARPPVITLDEFLGTELARMTSR